MAKTQEPAAKSAPPRRSFTSKARVIGKPEDRTLRFIGTDETRDRYNTFFKRDGWSFDEFRKNPVFLFHHNHDAATPTLPIGRVVNIEKTDESGTPGWAFDVQFVPRKLYPFADVVYEMYREGFMNAVSVGFIVKQRKAVTDEAEQKTLGFEPGYAEIYERTELMELSAVPVPGNQNALIQRMRSFVPEALQPAIKAEPGEELDERWLTDRLNLVREALQAEADAKLTAAVDTAMDVARTSEATPEQVSAVINTNTTEQLEPSEPIVEREADAVQRELLNEIKALRTEVSALREQIKAQPTPTASVGAPPVPARDLKAAQPTRDPLELVLDGELDTLKRIASNGRR